jgi:hypothetical protein
MAVSYLQDLGLFVADKAFPLLPVSKQTGTYFTYSKGDLLRNEAKLRAPGTEAQSGGVGVSHTATYNCQPYAWKEYVTDEDYANADTPLKPDQDAAENVAFKMALASEVAWAAAYFKTGVWDHLETGVASGASTDQFLCWNVDGSNPNLDISAGRSKVQGATGRYPNIAVISADVYEVLKSHTKIIDRIQHTQRGIITTDVLASLWDLNAVYVAGGVYNSAKFGASDSVAHIMSDGVLLAYAEKSPGLKKASAGYCFSWTGIAGGAAGSMAMQIKKYREEAKSSQAIEGNMPIDHKVVCTDLACFFTNVLN